VVISKIAGNRVSIGIEAPRDLKVVRGELEWHDVPSTLPIDLEGEGATGEVKEPPLERSNRPLGLSSFNAKRRQVG
ncbi:MAG: carbon storage regulator, partial [Pirellulaceae bacterium]